MGLRSVTGQDPVQAVRSIVTNDAEKVRIRQQLRRVAFYQDDIQGTLRSEIYKVFQTPKVRERILSFLDMATSNSFFRRVVDEVCRFTYNPVPSRQVTGQPGDPAAYAAFALQTRLDRRMDIACRILESANSVALFPRYSDSLDRWVLDIIEPGNCYVISHPDDPTTELAFIYNMVVDGQFGREVHRVYWDDEVSFRLDNRYEIVRTGGEPLRLNPIGRIPVVVLHKQERFGTYWDVTTGSDLEAAQLSISLLNALSLKLLKSQGEKQIVLQGDTAVISQNQTLDSEAAIVAPSDTSITTLDLRSDARHYTDVLDGIVTRVAANYGLSRDRMNATGVHLAEDAALLERRQEMVRICEDAEQQLFDLMIDLSKTHPNPAMRLSDDATLRVDFREIETRLAKKDQLELWEQQIKMGLKSVEDMLFAENPDINTIDEAHAEMLENLESWATWVEMRRRLNAPSDITEDSGNSAADNGRAGGRANGGIPAQAGNEDDARNGDRINGFGLTEMD